MIFLSPQAKKEIDKLPKPEGNRILKRLREFEKTGRGDMENIEDGLRRLRIGDYRAYYHPKGDDIYILRVLHRRSVYRRELIDVLLKGLPRRRGKH